MQNKMHLGHSFDPSLKLLDAESIWKAGVQFADVSCQGGDERAFGGSFTATGCVLSFRFPGLPLWTQDPL